MSLDDWITGYHEPPADYEDRHDPRYTDARVRSDALFNRFCSSDRDRGTPHRPVQRKEGETRTTVGSEPDAPGLTKFDLIIFMTLAATAFVCAHVFASASRPIPTSDLLDVCRVAARVCSIEPGDECVAVADACKRVMGDWR